MSAPDSTASAISAYECPRTPASSLMSASRPLMISPVRASRMPRCIARSVPVQPLLEELQDPAILVGPGIGTHEAVVFDRIHGELPIGLAQLDQALGEPHHVLEVHVDVDHAVVRLTQRLIELGK